jgi:antitoxin ParD1/3/4
MNISLTPELEAFVQSAVDSGQYASSSEVLRDGLRLLQRQRDLLRAQIEAGLKSRELSDEEASFEAIVDRAERKRKSRRS